MKVIVSLIWALIIGTFFVESFRFQHVVKRAPHVAHVQMNSEETESGFSAYLKDTTVDVGKVMVSTPALRCGGSNGVSPLPTSGCLFSCRRLAMTSADGVSTKVGDVIGDDKAVVVFLRHLG